MNRGGNVKWTAFCSWPGTPRGQYDEEVDVIARNEPEARRKAQAVLDDPQEYEPGGRVRRVARVFVPDVQVFAIR